MSIFHPDRFTLGVALRWAGAFVVVIAAIVWNPAVLLGLALIVGGAWLGGGR